MGKRHCIGKVLVDATQDKSEDQYSEGDVEDELLAIVRKGRREEALRQDTRWPVLYHLSEERQNIVSWLPLEKTDRVLEIGCGCGAVTGALCRRAGHVDAVEISPRRAEIAAYRNQDCANLTIHVGNLNDLALGQAYDVVTLIGVLEYAIRSSPILSLSSVNGNPLTPASCPSMSIMPGTALRPTASVRQSMSRRGGGPSRNSRVAMLRGRTSALFEHPAASLAEEVYVADGRMTYCMPYS